MRLKTYSERAARVRLEAVLSNGNHCGDCIVRPIHHQQDGQPHTSKHVMLADMLERRFLASCCDTMDLS